MRIPNPVTRVESLKRFVCAREGGENVGPFFMPIVPQ